MPLALLESSIGREGVQDTRASPGRSPRRSVELTPPATRLGAAGWPSPK